MMDIYECEFCGIVVEYNKEDMQEHNEFNSCNPCFHTESDTGEVY